MSPSSSLQNYSMSTFSSPSLLQYQQQQPQINHIYNPAQFPSPSFPSPQSTSSSQSPQSTSSSPVTFTNEDLMKALNNPVIISDIHLPEDTSSLSSPSHHHEETIPQTQILRVQQTKAMRRILPAVYKEKENNDGNILFHNDDDVNSCNSNIIIDDISSSYSSTKTIKKELSKRRLEFSDDDDDDDEQVNQKMPAKKTKKMTPEKFKSLDDVMSFAFQQKSCELLLIFFKVHTL